MKIHPNAPLGPKGRALMVGRVVEEGWTVRRAAEAAGVSERTTGKWVARRRSDGQAGLVERSSEPKTVASRTACERIEAIAALRRLRMTSAEIAERPGMALSTVSGILTRSGLGRLSGLEPPEPPSRYQRERPGELIHIDVKKLGRIGHRGAGRRASANRGPGRRSARAARRSRARPLSSSGGLSAAGSSLDGDVFSMLTRADPALSRFRPSSRLPDADEPAI
jgi:transposase